MSEVKCFECGNEAKNKHHVIPKSKGGFKTIDLCEKCHSLIHNKKMDSGYLTKLGLMKKRYDFYRILFIELVLCESHVDVVENVFKYNNLNFNNFFQNMIDVDSKDFIEMIFEDKKSLIEQLDNYKKGWKNAI